MVAVWTNSLMKITSSLLHQSIYPSCLSIVLALNHHVMSIFLFSMI